MASDPITGGDALASAAHAARDDTYRRALWTAIGINAAMAIIEGVGSLFTGSIALMADAIDFVEDVATYLLTLFVLGRSIRWRATAGLVKGLGMALPGVWIAVQTVRQVVDPTPPSPAPMGVIALAALAANLSCAWLLVRFRTGDSNVRSAWLSSRNDAIANVGIILAAAAVALTATPWPDILIGGVIAAINLHAAYLVILQAATELRQG